MASAVILSSLRNPALLPQAGCTLVIGRDGHRISATCAATAQKASRLQLQYL